MPDYQDVRVPIRIVQRFTYTTVAHPLDGTPLHLISVHYPNGDVLDGNALTNGLLADHIKACQDHLTAALENEHG